MKWVHGHTQNLSYDKYPTWRHGRGWFGFGRGDSTPWSAEWMAFVWNRWFSLGFGKGGGECGNQLKFHASVPYFTLYVSRKAPWHFRPRDFDAYWFEGSFWLRLWGPDSFHEGYGRSRDRPWWQRTHCFNVRDWFTGRPRYDCVKGEPFEVFVPMPEGCYRAVATPETRTRTYRFGVTAVSKGVWLDIPGGIPHSGKGENGWDCGDDGLCGCGAETVEQAIGNAVASVMKARRRYGHDSKRTGIAPSVVLNAGAAR